MQKEASNQDKPVLIKEITQFIWNETCNFCLLKVNQEENLTKNNKRIYITDSLVNTKAASGCFSQNHDSYSVGGALRETSIFCTVTKLHFPGFFEEAVAVQLV